MSANTTPGEDGAGQGSPDAGPLQLLQNMPQAMRQRQQWLMWRFERYEGDKKPRKVPYYVNGRKRRGEQGSAEDRAELCTFDLALQALERHRWDGIGFAFLPGDGLIGIDIDGAVDDDGVVSERCQSIIQACASYTELSPSGRGVHIIVEGETETFKDNRIGLEVFCGRQFFTCTGRLWPGTPAEVAPIDEHTLRRLKATVRESKAGAKGPAGAQPVQGVDAGAADQRVSRYCLAALDNAVRKVRGTGEGGRNDALNEAAFNLAQLVHTGGIGEGTIRGALTDAGMAIGLELREIETTLRSGISAGLQQPRALPPPDERIQARAARKAKRAAGEAAGGASTPSRGSANGGGDGGPPRDAGDDAGGPDEPRHWRKEMVRERGRVADCRENVYLLLVNHPALAGVVGYDEFAHRVLKLRPPPWDSDAGEWTTNDDYLLGLWLVQNEAMVVRGEGTLVAGVAMAAFANRFHPVLRYLGGLPAWDGVPRLAHWLPECLGAEESTYTQLVGAWFILGMVRRVQQPGCQMDYMVVLEGLQGKRKSTALRTLVGNDDWFADTPIRIGDKDALLSLAGKWLYEVGELDSFNKAEVTAVKQYVSSRVDRVREPFARRPADRPRSGVFAGSTNQSEYFRDPTGARRFWPVACNGEIDIDKLAQWRDQLFAEALHRLASDDPEDRRYYPTREETEAYLMPEQEKREIVDPWYERLALWVESNGNFGESGLEVREVNSFTSADLLTKCLMVPQDRIDGGRQMATRVGIAMHKLGWHKHRDAKGARLWRYWRPGCSPAQAAGVDGAAGGPAAELHEF